MASPVYLMDYNKTQNLSACLSDVFEKMGLNKALKDKRVAVKLHMGEEGCPTYIRPGKVRRVIDRVKKAGGKPFLCDTTTLYPYKRFTSDEYLETAKRNGFSRETMDCPIIIIDGDGYDSVRLPLQKKSGECHFDTVPMARGLMEADFLLIVSHVKGHLMTGIGGAIKNVGMGCVDKKGKADQHYASRPLIHEDRCTGCGACEKACKFDAVTIVDDKIKIDYGKCIYCSSCLFACPDKVLYWEEGYQDKLGVLMAHMAYGVLDHFGENAAALNFLEDMTVLCDCCSQPGRILMPDIGMLASRDPVAVDAASLDLIDLAEPLAGAGMPDGPDRFGKYHKLDSRTQVRTAGELGCGTADYELVELK